MGDGRAEGSSATGDRGQAAALLMPDTDGTGSCSLLESDAHSNIWNFTTWRFIKRVLTIYESSARVVGADGSWLRQINWTDCLSPGSCCWLDTILYVAFPLSLQHYPHPLTATSNLVFPWGTSSSGGPWLLKWQLGSKKKGAEAANFLTGRVFQTNTASTFPLKKCTNLYKVSFPY